MSMVDRLQLMEQGKKRKPRRVRQLSSMRSRNRRIWRRQQGMRKLRRWSYKPRSKKEAINIISIFAC